MKKIQMLYILFSLSQLTLNEGSCDRLLINGTNISICKPEGFEILAGYGKHEKFFKHEKFQLSIVFAPLKNLNPATHESSSPGTNNNSSYKTNNELKRKSIDNPLVSFLIILKEPFFPGEDDSIIFVSSIQTDLYSVSVIGTWFSDYVDLSKLDEITHAIEQSLLSVKIEDN